MVSNSLYTQTFQSEPLEKHMTQGYFSRTFQNQNDFPGLSRSWNFQEKNRGLSMTFHEAWEPCFTNDKPNNVNENYVSLPP